MKMLKITIALLGLLFITSCASGYMMINPEKQKYVSTDINNGVSIEYKYNVLNNKKYIKKEDKKGVKLVALKIKNNTNKDLIFGKDVKLSYLNGEEVTILEREEVFKMLKQKPATHLFYLLLAPLSITKTTVSQNRVKTTSTPIGLAIAPLISGGNILVASSANKKFKTELLTYDLMGSVVKKGETSYGLIGIKSSDYDGLKIKLE